LVVQIRFHGPFESLAEKEACFELPHPVSVRELIGLIGLRYAPMRRYAGIETDADLSAHLVFFRDGKLLRLSDLVRDEEVIQILLPSTGG
jgi:hypothetical protein